MHIVTLTSYADIHALILDRALETLGVKHSIWLVPDFPRRQGMTASIASGCEDDQIIVSRHGGKDIEGGVDVVWNRRPAMGNLFHKQNHAGDAQFIKQETNLFLRSIWLTYAATALWINDPQAKFAADAKLLQLAIARRAGLKVPSTLASNDPSYVIPFVERHGGRAILKSFHGHAWELVQNDELSVHVIYASIVRIDEIRAASIEICPAIYQQYYEKNFELRVVLCGKTLFAVKIDSQSSAETKIDFRAGQTYLPLSEYELPQSLQDQLLRFAELMGVLFGSFDILVSTAGEYIFLEFNEQGQFLWIEFNNPNIPILQFVLDFFVSGDPKFRWRRPANPTRLAHFADDGFWSDFERAVENLEYAELNTRHGQG